MNNNESKNPLFQMPEICPSCGVKYSGAHANIVSSDKNSIVVHVTCPKCETSILSNVSFGSLGVMAVGMLTDLGEDEFHLLSEKTPITVDEVIEMHEYIEKKGFINLN